MRYRGRSGFWQYSRAKALFDPDFYATQLPTPPRRSALWRHYLDDGVRQGLDPMPLFSTTWYLEHNPHVAADGMNPFVHYVLYGQSEGRAPHPLFDPVHYLQQPPALLDVEPLHHYLRHGSRERRDPHPLFQTTWYCSRYQDVAESGINPLAHYLTVGGRSGLWPNEFFDPSYYLRQDPRLTDDDEAVNNPLLHYLLRGTGQGRNPHPAFDTNWYLMAHPDVAAAGVNPLAHFLLKGRQEGREPTGDFSTRWFAVQSPTLERDQGAAAVNFLARSSPAGLADAKATRVAEAKESLRSFLKSGERLVVGGSAEASVTVVVVVWNQAHFTLECLRSLAASSVAVKTVVVDNDSTDETPELLGRVDGIDVVRNKTNVGFLEAANDGLLTSRTPYTLLLNNDATVAPDTIERALEVMADPTVGAVAGRIVLPNGLLQEAGSFLWRDGSAQGYLRGQPASIGAAMHRREVDFGSGAFLLLRTSVVQSLGGFDPAFKPAYGEEVDLCLRMRKAGYRTVYDPRVVVEHVEFASSKDPSAALALQENHRAVLENRHRAELKERPRGDLKLAHRVAHWATHGLPGALVVDDRLPYPHQGGGNPRAREVLREITKAARGPVLLVPTHQEPFADWAPVWQEFGLDIEIYPEPGMAGLGRVLEQHAGRYRTLWVSRYHNMSAVLAAEERHPGLLDEVRVVYGAEAITALREAQRAALNGAPWTEEQVTEALVAETSAALRADVVLAVNELEASVFRVHGAEDVRVLGHALTVRPGPASFEDREGLVFVGRLMEEDSPNVDSLRWFFQEVWSRWAAVERPTLTLVGQVTPELAEEFATQGAVVTGPVGNVAPYLNAARVFFAPTRFAAGVPHKVHEAATAGVPVAATPLLAQQLGWTAGKHLLVGSEPAEFASSMRRLLDSPDLWMSVRKAALERVRSDCDPSRFVATIHQLLSELPTNQTVGRCCASPGAT